MRLFNFIESDALNVKKALKEASMRPITLFVKAFQ